MRMRFRGIGSVATVSSIILHSGRELMLEDVYQFCNKLLGRNKTAGIIGFGVLTYVAMNSVFVVDSGRRAIM